MTALTVAHPQALEPATITPAEEAVIREMYARGATDAEFSVFIATCRRTRLSPMARQIYLVKRWDSNLNREVMTTQTSIDGLRLIASRTGEYLGQTPPEWCGSDGVWKDVWLSDNPPMASRIGVLRAGFAQPMYGVATYRSYCARKKSGDPTSMWENKADIMIAKCAEALALRKAFPQELSGLLTEDEMGYNPQTGEVRQHTSYTTRTESVHAKLKQQALPAPTPHRTELMLTYFAKFGIEEPQITKALDCASSEEFTDEHFAILKGWAQQLKDGRPASEIFGDK